MIASVALLVTLMFVIVTASLGFVAYAGISHNGGSSGSTGPKIQCSDVVVPEVTIPDTGFQCFQNGKNVGLFCIDRLTNGKYDFVVATQKTAPLAVCIGYCSQYSNGVCSGPVVNGLSAQQNFDYCMTQLNSETCVPPIPIAEKGSQYYYAYSPTCSICDR